MARKIKKNRVSSGQGKVGLSKSSQIYSDNNDQKRPIFSFYQIKGEYCISDCQVDEKASLIDTIHKLSKLTWLELKGNRKHGLGTEKIEHNAIKGCSIPSFIIEQDITLLAFRFCGKKPMVGYRENQIFHILWLDRNFTLYNHGS